MRGRLRSGGRALKDDEGGATVGLADSGAGLVHRFSHEAMATVFEVHAAHADRSYAGQATHAAFELVDRLEQELSRFVPNSDVSRVSALARGGTARVGPAAMDCLVVARHLHELTGGAFDVSIGTGLASLELRPDELEVRAGKGGVRIDLGGIGKGYAVDRMAAVLEEWDLAQALVHGGWSSVLALDPPAGQDSWTLALRGPGASGARAIARVPARQQALGASGTGKGDHILDPRTGTTVAAAATWVSLPRSREPDHWPAAVADALSTACMMLAPQRIAELCRQNPGLEVWRLESTGEPGLVHLGSPSGG